MSENEPQAKDQLIKKNRYLKAIFCTNTSLKFVKIVVHFNDGSFVEPELVRQIGDKGMGEGVYHFFEPPVEIPANAGYNLEFEVAEECKNQEYDMQLYQTEVEPEPGEVVMDT